MTFNLTDKDPKALNPTVYPCNYTVPKDHVLNHYKNVTTCTCASCTQSCTKPSVNADISFFAGFDAGLTFGIYGGLVVFSIIF